MQGPPPGRLPGNGNPNLPPLEDARIRNSAGPPTRSASSYVMGANGPNAYDCSSLTCAAFAQISITMPRTAQSQRDWLAAGNGHQILPGQEQPGDLIFINSYLGPNLIGHVAIIWDPATKQTVEAASPELGVIHGTYETSANSSIYEMWRVGNLVRSASRRPARHCWPEPRPQDPLLDDDRRETAVNQKLAATPTPGRGNRSLPACWDSSCCSSGPFI